MMKYATLLLLALCCSCQKQKPVAQPEKATECAKSAASGTKKFQMYQLSEMSLLMEQMYVDNQRLKARIQKGDTIGKFPQHFLEIHKAAMTDPGENDAFFKKQAAAFLSAQEQIYTDPGNAKAHFNEGVNACISCHEVKCTGPITRIKKLYID